MWFSLRAGFANTAAIAALASLPLVSVAAAMLTGGSEPAHIVNHQVRSEQVVWQPDPMLAHLAE
jgi:hypothetical protein